MALRKHAKHHDATLAPSEQLQELAGQSRNATETKSEIAEALEQFRLQSVERMNRFVAL